MTVNLSQLVGDYISQHDGTQQDQFRLTNIARRGVRILNLDVMGELRTQVLQMNANKTVDLPQDYIHFTKLGILNGKGEISTFRENTDLAMASDLSGGRFSLPTSSPTSIGDPNYLSSLNYINQGSFTQLLGIGSGSANIGEYRVDEANRVIVFNSSVVFSQIIMEYLSDGSDENDGDMPIDERAYEAMLAWIEWKDYAGKTKKHSGGEVQAARKEYYNEKELLRLRLRPAIKSIINEKIRDSIKGAPKA